MKHFISFVWILLFTAISTAQNAPILKVGNTQVGLNSLDISVEIIGNKATTTFDMLYYNPTNQVLEGELSFPLGENFNVSRFALDVNGKLREAVVVDKELGRIAFEEVVRRRVDPALLEKGTGNNYKARIYPIPAKGNKRVVLAYEQELLYKADGYYFDLPLHFKNQLKKFNLDITVFEQDDAPVIEKGKVSGLNFKNWKRNYRTQLEKVNYIPNKSLLIKIPTKVNTQKLMVSDDYFYSHLILNPEKKLRKKASKITLLWDTSLSMKDRDIDKEIALLDTYFSYLNDVKVYLKTFSNELILEKTFTIKNGNWNTLKSVLKNSVCDGGTNYSFLNSKIKNSDLILLFSDGIQSLSDAKYYGKTPVIVANSVKKSNHAALKMMAESSSGSYVNLTVKSAQEAFNDLKYQQYQFLGYKSYVKNIDVYPRASVNIDNTFSITGKNLNNYEDIVLYFGYDSEITESITLNLKEAQKGTTNIPRLWAQKRLAFLQQNSKANKKDIIQLATKYGLVTDYTSLIVLELVSDYVRYKIEPPAELLEEYNRLLAETERDKSKKETFIDVRQEQMDDEEMIITDQVMEVSNNRLSRTPMQIRDNLGMSNESEIIPVEDVEVMEDVEIIKEIAEVEESIEEIPFMIIEEAPIFPGCEGSRNSNERKKCFSNKAQEIISQNFNVSIFNDLGFPEGIQRVYTMFTIDEKGRIKDIRIRAPHKNIEAEVRRVLRLFPTMLPGRQRGRNVNVRYTLPIILRANADGKVFQSTSNTTRTPQTITETRPTPPVSKHQHKGTLQVADLRLNTPYIQELRQFKTVYEAYDFYLLQRTKYEETPAYYVDVSSFFRNEFEAIETSNRILSNIAETDFDNYELLKVYGYQLQATNAHKLALFIFKRILELRTEDVQSYRDLALAYENVGDCQEAFNILNDILSGKIYEQTHRRNFAGLNPIVMNEMNHLLEKYKGDIDTSKQSSLVFEPETYDVRIVVDWNHNDTDIDLHIIDPNREECSYKNTHTKIGGSISKDMTQGFGPEEFTLKNAIKGDYFIKVNYYGDRYQKIENPTFMKVTMYSHYGTLKQTKEVKIIRLTKSRDNLVVAKMSF
ncbi:VIT domain-containing protein [uncultured Kordia sp.]|uniref:VIT domain-containing protein n=1 Tax=uncultured Kordia sp. TaxID=507699 RepID=UPI0026331C23|nr:VIT domain-containing protein [uncultured Kordia sp.]